MARPLKNSCDYFPHDADMRNHRKIKALRNKFGPEGYAVWCMYLEYLTGAEGNQAEYSALEFELLSGDFGIEARKVREIIDYARQLHLLQLNDGLLGSTSLDERLEPVYVKRGRMRDLALSRIKKAKETEHQDVEEIPPSEPEQPVNQVVEQEEIPTIEDQSIPITEEEVIDLTDEINVPFEFWWDEYKKKVGDIKKLRKKWSALKDDERLKAIDHTRQYVLSTPDKQYRKNPETYLNNKSWNDEIIFKQQQSAARTVDEKFNRANSIIDAMFNK